MATLTLIALAIVLVLVVIILLKVNEVLRELRTPVVKKLNPDFNKQGRRVNVQETRQNPNNRPQQNAQRPAPAQATNPRPQQAVPTSTEAPRENRDRDGRDRDGRRDGRDRDGRRDGRDRDGRRDGRDRDGRRDGRDRDRNPRRSQEIFGNESAEVAAPVVADSVVSAQSVEVQAPVQRPLVEGRRPLEPRISEPDQDHSPVVAQTPASSDAPVASESADFDPSRIRHGRRTMVRKVPGMEPETPASNS